MVLAAVARTGQAPGAPVEARRLVGPAIMLACGVVSVLDAQGVAAKVAVGALVVGSELRLLLAGGSPSSGRACSPSSAASRPASRSRSWRPGAWARFPRSRAPRLLPRYLPAGWVRNLVVGLVAAAFGVSIMGDLR